MKLFVALQIFDSAATRCTGPFVPDAFADDSDDREYTKGCATSIQMVVAL